MECSDGSGISSRVYNGREDGVMGSGFYFSASLLTNGGRVRVPPVIHQAPTNLNVQNDGT